MLSVAETFARVCASAPPGDRDALVRQVYRRVHCRVDSTEDWSDRGRLGAHLTRADAALAAHRVPHHGFVPAGTAPDGRLVLTDPAGIRVFAPHGTGVRAGEAAVVHAPAVGVAQEGRWLIWSSTLDPAEPGLGRLYLNVTPARTFDGWLALTRAVADTGLVAHVKCTTSAGSSARADCVIAYGRPSDLPRLRDLVRAAVPDGWRDPEVAGFAWRLGPGLGAYVPEPTESAASSSGYGWATRLVDAYRAGGTAGEFEALGRALSRTARVLDEDA